MFILTNEELKMSTQSFFDFSSILWKKLREEFNTILFLFNSTLHYFIDPNKETILLQVFISLN